MARTRIHGWRLLAMAAALAVSGCDPYPAKNTAKPEILAVFATDGATPIDGVLAGATWTLSVASTTQAPATAVALQPVIFVRTNKPLDGATIQTADQAANSNGDCTPKDNWLSVSPAAASGNVWYSCYDPSSATPDEGAAIVLFQASSTTPISRAGGWFDVAALAGQSGAPLTYTLSGNVKDQDGNDLPISIGVTVSPPP